MNTELEGIWKEAVAF